MITIATLIAAGLQPTQARQFVAPLTEACERFRIDSPARLGAFIGQCRVESAGFTRLEESLHWRSPERLARTFRAVHGLDDASRLILAGPQAIANRVYSGRNGNGAEATDDGWRYRGRGLLQITGREKYTEAALDMGRPYVDEPDLVAQPLDACLTAAWYWARRALNRFADSGQHDMITREINGPAMLELDLRRQYSEDATTAFLAAA